MRKSKKVVALLVSGLMICSLFSGFGVSAAVPTKTVGVTNSFDAGPVAPGANIAETITLSTYSQDIVGGIIAFKFVVAYDSANFSVASVAPASESTTIDADCLSYSTHTAGQLVILYAPGSIDYISNPDGLLVPNFTPITAGSAITVTYTALQTATGSGDFTLSAGSSDTYFVDAGPRCQEGQTTQDPALCLAANVLPVFDSSAAQTIEIGSSDPIPGLSNYTVVASKTLDDNYTVTNVISNVAEGTMVSDMTTTLAPSNGVALVFKKSDGTTVLSSGDVVGTGTTIEVDVNGTPTATYTIQIYGDLDGDGYITYDDFGAYIDWFVGTATFDANYSLGADIDNSGYIDYDDFGYYIDWFVGTIQIYQDPAQTLAQYA